MASFRKRGKKWEYRITYTINGEKHTESKGGFTTKKEAEFHATNRQTEINKGINIFNSDVTFYEYMFNWANVYKKDIVTVRTFEFIIRACKKAKSLFGNQKITQIKRTDYQKALNTLNDKHISTVRKYHNYFNAAFESAVSDGIITLNPAKKCIILGNRNSKQENDKFLSYEETKLLIKELYNDIKPEYVSRYIILLAIYTGMRYSELLGLTWDRIDFKERTLLIDRTWDNFYHTGFLPTKNKSERTIALSEAAINLLNTIPKINDLVFYPLPTNNAVNTALTKACKRANIKRITLHGLRHTHGSILLYQGCSIMYISKRLGHKSVQITQNIYLHLLDELKQQDDDKMDNIMNTL